MNLIKKTTIGVLAFSVLATSYPAFAKNHYQTGFVAGGSIGYTAMRNNVSKDGFVALPNFLGASKNTENAKGFLFSLDTGYRYLFAKDWLVALNLSVSKDFAKTKKTDVLVRTHNTTVETSRLFHVTPSLMIGKIFSERWMVFADFGLSISRFKLKGSTAGAAPLVAQKISKIFTKVGFAPAIGLEYSVNQNLAVTTKFTYEYFGATQKEMGPMVDPAVIAGTKYKTKVKPSYFTGKIGLMYKF